jgi:hypothetical protein
VTGINYYSHDLKYYFVNQHIIEPLLTRERGLAYTTHVKISYLHEVEHLLWDGSGILLATIPHFKFILKISNFTLCSNLNLKS